jgi:hypothetical protein
MRYSVLGSLGFLATHVAAAPGGGPPECSSYEYDNICPNCPYHPNYHHPRELAELSERGGNGHVCHKDCPTDYQQCLRYDYGQSFDNSYSNQAYSLYYQQDYSCPANFKYQVVVKIEETSGDDYLNVYFADQSSGTSKRGNAITSCNLGIYQQQVETYNPNNFNYNNYCHGNYCSVPAENIPGYPDLCNQEIYLAVGNDKCYNDYGLNEQGYKEGTKYIQVKIVCQQKMEKKCLEYCCCPKQD